MCFFKKKISTPAIKKESLSEPPQPSIDALEIIWNKDKTEFCEIVFRNNTYRYRATKWQYDNYYCDYFWGDSYIIGASHFETIEHAREYAKRYLEGKE